MFGADRPRTKDEAGYALVPREDSSYSHGKITPREDGRIHVSLFILAVAALSLRLEAYRRVTNASECTIPSVEIWLPLLLALYDSLRFQKRRFLEENDRIDASIYESLASTLRGRWLSSRFRYVPPVAIVCLGCHFLLSPWKGLNSTFICSIVSGEQKSVPLAQYAGLLLDGALAAVVWEYLPRSDGAGLSPKRNMDFWSYVMATTASIWILVAAGVYYFAHAHRFYVVLWDVPILSMLFSITVQAILFFIACITILQRVSLLQSLSPGSSDDLSLRHRA